MKDGGMGRREGTLFPYQFLLFVEAVSGILRKWNLQIILEIFQGFWIEEIFSSKILYLGGTGRFVRTFTEI